MTAPLVVVEDASPARGGGVVLAPRITIHGPAGPPFRVRLRLPDGRERAATAVLDAAHIRGPNGAFALVRLLGLAVEDVPSGTEVWQDSADA